MAKSVKIELFGTFPKIKTFYLLIHPHFLLQLDNHLLKFEVILNVIKSNTMKQILLVIIVFLTFTFSAFSQCTMSISHTDILCWYNYDGTATVNITSGVPPFSYQWSNSFNGPGIYGLSAGTYYVTVTDSAGCVMTDSVTIYSPPVFNLINDSVKNVTCYGGNNGEAWITASGGTPPYTYDWGGGENITHKTGLSEGYYYPNVTDSNGCWTNAFVSISSPPQITFYEIINPTYCLNAVGSISLSMTGGTPYSGSNPYNYLWSHGPTVSYVSFLAPGIYTVTVTDSLGCSAFKDYILNDQSFYPQVDSVNNVTCNGMSNGNVGITPVGGTAPYTYIWSNGGSTPVLTNLGPGVYYVTVQDVNFPSTCPGYAMVTITNPGSLSDSPGHSSSSCFGDSTGYINLYISGGTPNQTGPPYNYVWSNGCTSEYNTGLHDGTYSVTVTDANNCPFLETFTLTSPPPLLLDSFIVHNVSCYGMNDASIAFYLSGGSPPYRYSMGGEIYDTVGVFSWLPPNNPFLFYCQDYFGCSIPVIDTIFSQPDSIIISFSQTDPTCVNNDGSINIITTGGMLPYTAVWDNIAYTGLDLTGLGQGLYNTTITDANGCENNLGFELIQTSTPPVLSGVNVYAGGTYLPPDEAEIYLFKPSNTGAAVMDTVAWTMNSASIWQFNGLMPGSYYLQAVLINPASYPNLLNSYYDSTFQWQNAVPIVLSCNDTANIIFNMYEMNPVTTGNGAISGTVILLTGTKSTEATGEPVPGAEILIEQEPNDIPVQCALTDTLGRYSFSGLEPGTGYHLLVDIPGYPLLSTYQNITISSNDSIPNMNFLVDSTSGGGIFIDTATVISFIPNEGVSVEVYPNPFTSFVNVKFYLNQARNISIELFDVMGRKAQALDAGNLLAGEHEFSLKPDSNLKGACYLVIHAGNTLLIKKLIASPR